MRHMPNFPSNIGRFDEKIVGCVREHGPRPRHVDHGIDDDVGDMDSFGTKLARQRLG